jgi:hypothetical protein
LPLLVLVLVEASEVPTLDEVGVAVCEMDGRVTVVEVGGVSWAAVAARVSRAELSRPSMLDMAGRTSPAETPELAESVLVRTSMEEAGRPREAAIAAIALAALLPSGPTDRGVSSAPAPLPLFMAAI